MKGKRGLFDADGLFSYPFLRWFETQTDSTLLETARQGGPERRSYIFCHPTDIIECDSPEKIADALQRLDEAWRAGLYAAGFLSYELGYFLEDGLPGRLSASTPLLRFGLYENPCIYDHLRGRFVAGGKEAQRILRNLPDVSGKPQLRALSLRPGLDEKGFCRAVAGVKENIRRGNTYQVNFSFKMHFPWTHRPADLYWQLRRGQRVPYAAWINGRKISILSFSPELFFRLQNGTITLKPMKGTAARGRWAEEDEVRRAALLSSTKERAENLMIVDLIRNDAGRLARTGSVEVPDFFQVEKYETVFQATSTIRASLRPKLSFTEVISKLFPCGSVTGAPKIRTMQIIHDLEEQPRGIYTGSIGFLAPRRRLLFNVAIRSVLLDRRQGRAELGVGSGITYDSNARAEYAECLAKARFVTEPTPDFELLETLKWDSQSGFFLLEGHLSRLARSAAYFEFEADLDQVDQRLRAWEKGRSHEVHSLTQLVVRLRLDRRGRVRIDHRPLVPAGATERVALFSQRIRSSDRFLFHKTTHRPLYERALEEARQAGLFDVIFLNERGEVTEGARTNVVIKQAGRYWTPPCSCGLLPGVFRQFLFESPRVDVAEKVLHPDDLTTAEELFLCNSVRGLQAVELDRSPSSDLSLIGGI